MADAGNYRIRRLRASGDLLGLRSSLGNAAGQTSPDRPVWLHPLAGYVFDLSGRGILHFTAKGEFSDRWQR